MNALGWIFLIASWMGILLINLFCILKLMGDKEEKS